MDYLSLLTLQAEQPIFRSGNKLDGQHEKAIPFLSKHKKSAFLDNDDAGKRLWKKLQKWSLPVMDISKRYAEYKDVYDYLCGKKLSQFDKKQKTETEKTMPKIGKRIKR